MHKLSLLFHTVHVSTKPLFCSLQGDCPMCHQPLWHSQSLWHLLPRGQSKKKEEAQKDYGTWCSQVVSNPSTNQARRDLTSLISLMVLACFAKCGHCVRRSERGMAFGNDVIAEQPSHKYLHVHNTVCHVTPFVLPSSKRWLEQCSFKK